MSIYAEKYAHFAENVKNATISEICGNRIFA